METAFIVAIVGLASVYLVRKFYHSLQNKDGIQCGCGCTSCPKEDDCTEQPAQTIHHIN